MTYSIERNAPNGITRPFKGITSEQSAIELLSDLARGMRRQGFKAMIRTDTRAVYETGAGILELRVVS